MRINFSIDWEGVILGLLVISVLILPFALLYVVYQLDRAEFRANLTVTHPVPEPLTTYCHWLDDESGFVCVTQTASEMIKEQVNVH